MPRFALALMPLAGCFFDADYSRAHVRCDDGPCDAAVGSGSADAHVAALTCADPGDATGTITDSTAGHDSQLATSCGAAVYNGPETVYRIEGPGTVTIGLDMTTKLAAYVIGACMPFATCETNTAATPAAPLTITLTSGMHLVVVDGITPGVTDSYRLTITR